MCGNFKEIEKKLFPFFSWFTYKKSRRPLGSDRKNIYDGMF